MLCLFFVIFIKNKILYNHRWYSRLFFPKQNTKDFSTLPPLIFHSTWYTHKFFNNNNEKTVNENISTVHVHCIIYLHAACIYIYTNDTHRGKMPPHTKFRLFIIYIGSLSVWCIRLWFLILVYAITNFWLLRHWCYNYYMYNPHPPSLRYLHIYKFIWCVRTSQIVFKFKFCVCVDAVFLE